MDHLPFDYPPTYVAHRPADYGTIDHQNRVALGRLRHHFFLSRLSRALQIVGSKGYLFTDYHKQGLRNCIVSYMPSSVQTLIGDYLSRNMFLSAMDTVRSLE